MELTKVHNVESLDTTYKLTITDSEVVTFKMSSWDRLLLEDVEGSPKTSDYLLGLERICRRIEEAGKKQGG